MSMERSAAYKNRQPAALDGGLFLKRMGGTGKHIDGNVDEPLAERPFQAFVAMTDAANDFDGTLRVLPGFHHVASRYFSACGCDAPEGGFTPLSPWRMPEAADENCWVTARRIPSGWAKLHKRLTRSGGSASDLGKTRTKRKGMHKMMHSLAEELRGMDRDDGFSNFVRAGDYVLWDPRLAHSTGETGK